MTFTLDLGLLGVFAGLVAIVLTIWFGIRPQAQNVAAAVDSVSKDIAAVRQKVDAIWDLLIVRTATAGSATVTLHLNNLGEVRVSARPGQEETAYTISTEKSIIRSDLIIRLSKSTNLEARERALFAGRIPVVSDLTPGKVLLRLPSTDAAVCTTYIRELVHWLDSEYFTIAEGELGRFENPILRDQPSS
ncbi:MAG: hypothetical protein HY680_06630 [Chloroflexi bacterium]|nr:hypothetical protein [Chloroflexota bacterium]